jgi:hypothetical protein
VGNRTARVRQSQSPSPQGKPQGKTQARARVSGSASASACAKAQASASASAQNAQAQERQTAPAREQNSQSQAEPESIATRKVSRNIQKFAKVQTAPRSGRHIVAAAISRGRKRESIVVSPPQRSEVDCWAFDALEKSALLLGRCVQVIAPHFHLRVVKHPKGLYKKTGNTNCPSTLTACDHAAASFQSPPPTTCVCTTLLVHHRTQCPCVA